jgi:DNA-binding GntR family transcriptional regulator
MEWEARLVSAHYKLASLERLMATGDASRAEDWKRYDWEFHQALISACGSRLLIETHSVIFDKYLRYQMVALSYRGDVASREHQALLDAALGRDADAAKKILAAHIEGGVEHALARGLLKQDS